MGPRMTIKHVLASFVLSSLAVAACGGSVTQEQAAPVAEKDLAAAYAHAFCDDIGPCCAASGYTADVAKCERNAQSLIQGFLVDPLQKSAVAYDANAAGECMAALRAKIRACATTFDDVSSACKHIFSGTRPLGASCVSSAECAASPDGEVQCDGISGAAGSICRVHVAPKGGEPCGPGGSKADVHTVGACEFGESDAFACDFRSGTCLRRRAIGESCDLTSECVPGAFCDARACKARIALGGACTPAGGCADSLRCDPETRTCAPQLANGSACTTDADCSGGRCNSAKCESSAYGKLTCTGM